MRQSELTGRQILMVVLAFVFVSAGGIGALFILSPSRAEVVLSRQVGIAAGLVALLSGVWFVKLARDAIADRRAGVRRRPAKVSGWFHVGFGALVAATGIVASVLTYQWAAGSGGGNWILYYGMIAWGVLQAVLGWHRLSQQRW